MKLVGGTSWSALLHPQTPDERARSGSWPLTLLEFARQKKDDAEGWADDAPSGTGHRIDRHYAAHVALVAERREEGRDLQVAYRRQRPPYEPGTLDRDPGPAGFGHPDAAR